MLLESCCDDESSSSLDEESESLDIPDCIIETKCARVWVVVAATPAIEDRGSVSSAAGRTFFC